MAGPVTESPGRAHGLSPSQPRGLGCRPFRSARVPLGATRAHRVSQRLMQNKEQEIVEDIRRVAINLGKKPGDQFGKSEYLNNGARFSVYDIHDGGLSWEHHCPKAGFKTKATEEVPDEIYFDRLLKAQSALGGRFPKTSERKKFGLNFRKRRWPTLNAFIKEAASKGIVALPVSSKVEKVEEALKKDEQPQREAHKETFESSRPIPPIPERTRRKKWERTGIVGFPYAPQDESGVVALFSVLCAQGIIPWQILDLNSGKGIDAVCYDDRQHREIRVELKHTLSRSNWNHSIDSLDYVVCWENRWRDFPKPVKELKTLVRR